MEDSDEQRFFAAIKCRRTLAKQAKMCRRSGSQVTDEIMALWSRAQDHGKMTCQKIHALYKSSLGDGDKDSENLEESEDPALNVTVNCIQDAMMVHNKIKGNPTLNAILAAAEDVLMDAWPWFKLSCLALTIKKSKKMYLSVGFGKVVEDFTAFWFGKGTVCLCLWVCLSLVLSLSPSFPL